MATAVLILASRGIAWGAMAIAGFVFLPFVMHLILGNGNRSKPGEDPHDSIGTKLRRFRDCRTVQCGHRECQAWNPRRARYCRHCGRALH